MATELLAVTLHRATLFEALPEERLLKRCEREFLRDNVDEFVMMGITLRTLANWLPKDDPDRDKARKLLEKLLPRIRSWKKMLGEQVPPAPSAQSQETAKRLQAAFAKRDWGMVHLHARELMADKGHDPQVLKQFGQDLAELNRKERLYEQAQREFMRDEVERFVAMNEVLRVLAMWLPREDPNRDKARKLLKKVQTRIRGWRR